MLPAPGVVEQLNSDNGAGGKEVNLTYRENRAIFENGYSTLEWNGKREALVKLIDGLAKASDTLFINYPIPEMGWDIFNENLRSIRENGKLVEKLMYPIANYYKRNEVVISVLESMSEKVSNLKLIRSDIVFCNSILEGFCVGQIDDMILYLDDDHLSDDGSKLFFNKVLLDQLFRTKKRAVLQ